MSDMTETDPNELERFLGLMHVVMPNLNDCFSYATADGERLVMDEVGCKGNTDALLHIFREYDFAGILAYVAKIRGCDPIPPLRSPLYQQAKEALDGWEYEND